MDKNRLLELLIKKHAGEISPQEQVELSQILKSENREADRLNHEVGNIFTHPVDWGENVEPQLVLRSTNKLLEKVNSKKAIQGTFTDRRKSGLYKRLRIAASVIIILGLIGFFLKKTNQQSDEESIVSTEKGFKSNLVLPDGTKVWINENSKLTYPKYYGNGQRNVTLEGEAYFDVVKDKDHPFIVHTKAMDIRVLGTAFNVRAYKEERNAEATLIRGAVEISLNDQRGRTILLSPNEKLIVKNSSAVTATPKHVPGIVEPEIVLEQAPFLKNDSTTLETQWIRRQISFDQEKLSDIAPRLEEWYRVPIIITNPKLLDRRLSGKIETETLPEALELFKQATNLRYRIEKDSVFIY